jgi:hypothetical protein
MTVIAADITDGVAEMVVTVSISYGLSLVRAVYGKVISWY